MDYVAFVFQLIGSILLTKKIWCAWLFLILGNIFWLLYFQFFHPALTIAIFQCIFFILLDLYGLWRWSKNKSK